MGEGSPHRRNGDTAIVDAENGTLAARMMEGDFFGSDIDGHGGPARSDVDAGDLGAGGGDGIGQEGEFFALGVGGADDVNALAGHVLPACRCAVSGALPSP